MDQLGQLVITQVKDADVIAISKVDAVEETSLEETIENVREHNDRAEILRLSSFTGLGIDRIVDIILEWKG